MADNAAYLIVNHDMNDFLESIDCVNPTLKLAIMRGGFRVPLRLATRKERFVYSLCNNIRKSGGTLATRNITLEMEEGMQKFKEWCTYIYMVQRPFNYDEATMDHLSDTWNWVQQLPPDPLETSVKPFEDRGDKRIWFEGIRNYLRQKKGASGYPIIYGIRPDAALPAAADDPGYGLPSFPLELYERGRHTGDF
jgi:hypothetical protein